MKNLGIAEKNSAKCQKEKQEQFRPFLENAPVGCRPVR
jgi:hypothetical protein